MRQGREGRKTRQVVLVSILLLWESMAESRWGPPEMLQSTSAGSPTPGASKQGYLSSNSCLQWLRAVPKDIKSTPSSPPAHAPQACLVHAVRESTQEESHRSWQPLRCSVHTEVNQNLPGNDRRLHQPLQD